MDNPLRQHESTPLAARVAACMLAAGVALAPAAQATRLQVRRRRRCDRLPGGALPERQGTAQFRHRPAGDLGRPGVHGAARASPAPPLPKPPRDARTIQGDAAIGKAGGDATGRKFIRQGMTEAEVLAKIGRPDATAGGSKQHQGRWSYLPAEGDPDTVTTITFSGGTVSDVSRKVVKR